MFGHYISLQNFFGYETKKRGGDRSEKKEEKTRGDSMSKKLYKYSCERKMGKFVCGCRARFKTNVGYFCGLCLMRELNSYEKGSKFFIEVIR